MVNRLPNKQTKPLKVENVPINIVTGRLDPKTDPFTLKYDVQGAIAVNVEAAAAGEHPLFKGRATASKVVLQLVLLPDGQIVGRVVG